MKSLMLLCGGSEFGLALAKRFGIHKAYWRMLSIDSVENSIVGKNVSCNWEADIEPQLPEIHSQVQKFSKAYFYLII